MTMIMSKSRLAANRLFGIDVSHHNGTIDWSKVKKAGVNFVYIKASEGLTLGDDQYATNIAGARAQSIPPGAYHFFIPTSSVAQQVTNFCSKVGSLQAGDLPPVLDAEVPSRWITAPAEAAQMHAVWLGMTVDQRVAKIVEWMDGVEKQLGVTPILYASSSFVRDILGGSPKLNKYLLWVAHYKVAAPTVPAPLHHVDLLAGFRDGHRFWYHRQRRHRLVQRHRRRLERPQDCAALRGLASPKVCAASSGRSSAGCSAENSTNTGGVHKTLLCSPPFAKAC